MTKDRAQELARKACAGHPEHPDAEPGYCNCREIAAAVHEAVGEYEHYVMTGRSEQHDQLVAKLDEQAKEIAGAKLDIEILENVLAEKDATIEQIARALREAVEERDRDWMADQIACIVRFNAEQGERETAKREAKVVEERERMLAEACERAKDPSYVVEDWAARHHHYLEPAAKTELIEKVQFALQSRLDEQAEESANPLRCGWPRRS
jgi:hypothetical protein